MKKIISLFLLVTLMSTSMTVYASVPIDDVSIDIQPIKYSEVLEAAENNSLEELLYPSGLTLPTKYCDLFAFASNVQEEKITATQVKRMLELNWPTSNGRYTMAEVLAAELYYYTYCWPLYSDDEMSPVIVAIDDLSGTQLSFRGDTYSAVVSDTTKFIPLLEEFEPLLTSLEKDEGNPQNSELYYQVISRGNSYGFPLTYGYDFNWAHYMLPDQTTNDVYTVRQDLANYYDGLKQLWSTFGIQFTTCQVNIVDTNHLLAYNNMTWAVLDDELLTQNQLPLFSGDLPTPPDSSVDKYFTSEYTLPLPTKIEPSSYRDPNVQYNPVHPSIEVQEPTGGDTSEMKDPPVISSPDKSSGASSNSSYQPNPSVGGFSMDTSENVITKRTYNLKDIFTIVSVIVVIALVIGLCVVDFMRRRENPANRWKRR